MDDEYCKSGPPLTRELLEQTIQDLKRHDEENEAARTAAGWCDTCGMNKHDYGAYHLRGCHWQAAFDALSLRKPPVPWRLTVIECFKCLSDTVVTGKIKAAEQPLAGSTVTIVSPSGEQTTRQVLGFEYQIDFRLISWWKSDRVIGVKLSGATMVETGSVVCFVAPIEPLK